jgi:hypothetical protein
MKTKTKQSKEIPPKGHKVRVEYKYADQSEFSTDRPPPLPEVRWVIDHKNFKREFSALVVKYLKQVSKKNLALAVCQVQECASPFNPEIYHQFYPESAKSKEKSS